ncbi:unnamed protein product [Nyctereutes procyonoides]|uniref:(raccoon dog) hypothetical protein n=1 Tax=Nyctereutes procyonoides TaxID=34880 RepID=A0A811YZY9_NYCPR|nr:unnamed protein product [Nyctereutes procyonoides]
MASAVWSGSRQWFSQTRPLVLTLEHASEPPGSTLLGLFTSLSDLLNSGQEDHKHNWVIDYKQDQGCQPLPREGSEDMNGLPVYTRGTCFYYEVISFIYVWMYLSKFLFKFKLVKIYCSMGSLGGSVVSRLPLAQGAILATRDRIPQLKTSKSLTNISSVSKQKTSQ